MIRLFLNVCKTFQKIKHLNFNDYDIYLSLSADSMADSFLCQSCKAPSEMLVHNGSYKRHLVFLDNSRVEDKFIEIKTFKCTSCSKCHSLLYSLIIPNSPYSIHFVIDLIYKRLTGKFKNIQQLCEFYDITERTFYRIWNRLLMDSKRMNTLLGAFGDILQAVSTLFHSENLFLHSALEDFLNPAGILSCSPASHSGKGFWHVTVLPALSDNLSVPVQAHLC